MHGETEPIGVTAPGGDEIQIRAGQWVMSDQRVRIGRHAEQVTALSLGLCIPTKSATDSNRKPATIPT